MWRREAVLIALAGLDAVVVSVLTALMALGVLDIDGTQLAAISAAVVAVTGFFAAILRAGVVSLDTHEQAVTDALYTPVPTDVGPESLRNLLGGSD